MSQYISRQEIATLTELSEDVIRKSETKFGLIPFKRNPTRRCVRYLRSGALKALQTRGLIN